MLYGFTIHSGDDDNKANLFTSLVPLLPLHLIPFSTEYFQDIHQECLNRGLRD